MFGTAQGGTPVFVVNLYVTFAPIAKDNFPHPEEWVRLTNFSCRQLCLFMSTFYNSFPSSYSFVFQCSSSWEKNPCLVSKPHSTWMHASGFRARGSFYLRNLSRLIFFLLSSLSQKGRYLGKSREKVSVSNRDTLRADFGS